MRFRVVQRTSEHNALKRNVSWYTIDPRDSTSKLNKKELQRS